MKPIDNRKIIEKLIRNLSHELKNPLTTIKGYSQLMSANKSDEKVRTKANIMILQQVERIDRMLQDLYAVFKLKTGETGSMAINDCIEEVVGEIRNTLTARIHVKSFEARNAVITDRVLFKRMISLFIEGFDWDNNKTASIEFGPCRHDNRDGLQVIYRDADLGDIDDENYFLPYSTKKAFIKGTELFEVWSISGLLGLAITMIETGEQKGFRIIF